MSVPLLPLPSLTPPSSSPPPGEPALRLPAPRSVAGPRRRWAVRLLLLALLAAAGVGLERWLRPDGGPAVRVTGTVTRGALPITVTERGELESASTVNAYCE